MPQAYQLFIILVTMLGLFIWGFWRYDIVALLMLIISVIIGIVPHQQAFTGFSNPAVITVACVMIITQAISQSGILDYGIKRVEFLFKTTTSHVISLTVISAMMSAFMNNVGALGLMMPIAIQTFLNNKKSPSIILMPIAFGSVLGGLLTAIGTPPNLLISQYRETLTGHPFSIFDFTPVGIIVAFFGVLFIATIGWRFVPVRRKYAEAEDLYQIKDYMVELKVEKNSELIKKTVKEMHEIIEADYSLIAIVHKGEKKFLYTNKDVIHMNDILIFEASPDEIKKIVNKGKLKLAQEKPLSKNTLTSEDIILMEAVVPPDSEAEGNSAKMLRMRANYGINLLALSRKGISFRQNLNNIRFMSGDVVLLQGNSETLCSRLVSLGFVPLAERDISLTISRWSFLPLLFFLIAITLSATSILPIEIAFAGAALAIVLSKSMPLRAFYHSIDWSVLLLLGAIIPIGQAIQTTGAANLITHGFLSLAGHLSPVFALGAVFVVTMTLSDLMNNAATAVVMAPIAVQIAKFLEVHTDPFLMAVAIGASCSFLTPIAHQNNTMVLGPGGYKFFDYMRLGLPLEIIIVIVAIPSILWIWPL